VIHRAFFHYCGAKESDEDDMSSSLPPNSPSIMFGHLHITKDPFPFQNQSSKSTPYIFEFYPFTPAKE